MSKLTKAEMRLHAQACEILQSDTLTIHERELVLKNWRPDAEGEVAHAGAFFTPSAGPARSFGLRREKSNVRRRRSQGAARGGMDPSFDL